MNNTETPHEEDEASHTTDSSSLNRLPDELILQILTKSPDLKTLCCFHLVSKRFSSIVLQLHTLSFIAPLLNPNPNPNLTSNNNLFRSLLNGVVFKPIHFLRRILPPIINNNNKPLPPIISSFYGDSFRSAVSFLSKFKLVKSLCIELPVSNHRGIDDSLLFKWKVRFSNRIGSFYFLSPNSVSDINNVNRLNLNSVSSNDNEEEGDMELGIDLFKRKVHVAFQCLKDVILRHRMLLYFIKDFPNLERISITDAGRRGTLCLSGREVDEVRGWIDLVSDDVRLEMNRIEVPVNVSRCYVPVLELTVSGCVMKGVTFVVMRMDGSVGGGNDCFVNGEGEGGVEDKVEAAYSEAVMEILENHKEKMKRLL